jgi:hypothetical protein
LGAGAGEARNCDGESPQRFAAPVCLFARVTRAERNAHVRRSEIVATIAPPDAAIDTPS